MSFELIDDDRRIVESKLQKPDATLRMPQSVLKKLKEAMKMDAVDLWRAQVVWDWDPRTKSVHVTIKPPNGVRH